MKPLKTDIILFHKSYHDDQAIKEYLSLDIETCFNEEHNPLAKLIPNQVSKGIFILTIRYMETQDE